MKDLSGTALLGPLAAMVIVALLVALTTPRFLEAGNLSNLVLQVSIVALVAIGSTLVIFSGGIDLSPGSAIALLSMVFAVMVKLIGIDFWLALIATLVLGALLGSVNGFVTAYLRIPSFITTLAALSAFKGLAFLFNNGSPVFQVSPLLEPIFYGHVLGLPLPLVYVILAFGAAHWLMRYARLGRCIYAVGRQSSRCAPIRYRRAPHPVPRVHDRRPDGGGRRDPDGRAAELRLAELRRRPRAAGDCGSGDRRREPRWRPRPRARHAARAP